MVISFKEHFLLEAVGKGLTVFDLDDTLFTSGAKVSVIKDKKVIKILNPAEFNTHKLSKGESFDFGQFKDAKVFAQTATPIAKMVEKAKAIIKNATAKGSKVIISTARADFDNRDLFLKVLESHGIKNVRVERAGNFNLGSTSKNKKVIFRKYLGTGLYSRVRFFDDNMDNLNSFLSLKKAYPGIEFGAYHVRKDGSTKTVS